MLKDVPQNENTIEKMLEKVTKNAKNEQIKSAANLDNVLQHCIHRHGTFDHCLLIRPFLKKLARTLNL
jgi:ferritin-like metal-binding protein YciE